MLSLLYQKIHFYSYRFLRQLHKLSLTIYPSIESLSRHKEKQISIILSLLLLLSLAQLIPSPTPSSPKIKNLPAFKPSAFTSIGEINDKSDIYLNQFVTLPPIHISPPIKERVYWINDGNDEILAFISADTDIAPIKQAVTDNARLPYLRGIIRPLKPDFYRPKFCPGAICNLFASQSIYLEVTEPPAINKLPIPYIPINNLESL